MNRPGGLLNNDLIIKLHEGILNLLIVPISSPILNLIIFLVAVTFNLIKL